MYIQKVVLKNFMRYEDASVELHEGFNAIVGQTDAGKSTLIRALIWVMYNKPSGLEMCRFGTDETSVILTTSKGDEIERFRSKKRNAYRLNDTWYDSMGGQVPEPVENALGVRLAELGPKLTDMLNVSRQMDGPFLLSSTGGDAAKILGNLSGITKIDQALSSLRPDISNAKKAIDVSTKLQKNYDASIGEFANLDQEAVHLEQISKALGQAQLVQTRLKSLEDLASRMDSYNEVYSTADTELRHHKHIISLDGSYEEASEIYMKTIELTGILNEMEQYSIALEFLTEQLEEEAVELTQYETRFQEILHEAGYCPTCGGKT